MQNAREDAHEEPREVAAVPVDVAIVGGGPVGIACAVEATRQGLSHIVLERGALLNTIVGYPTYTVFFSTPDLLEIGGVPFVSQSTKPSRREALVYYRKVAERFRIDARLREEVLDVVRRGDGTFDLLTSSGAFRARYVIVATGFFDNPNLLGVPGEGMSKVTHYYKESFPYAGSDVLVVGGKNSAVEAALDLYRGGARVSMAVRGPEFGRSVKYWLKPDIENRVKEGSIRALFGTTVEEIHQDHVVLRSGAESGAENGAESEAESEGARVVLRNDFVVALTGYHPDFTFLRRIGIEVTPDGQLVCDARTMETGVPGLYVAGVVAAGVAIGKLFIENGRLHAAQIVGHILEREGRTVEAPFTAPALRRFQDGE